VRFDILAIADEREYHVLAAFVRPSAQHIHQCGPGLRRLANGVTTGHGDSGSIGEASVRFVATLSIKPFGVNDKIGMERIGHTLSQVQIPSVLIFSRRNGIEIETELKLNLELK
jgi:hypothetical protein